MGGEAWNLTGTEGLGIGGIVCGLGMRLRRWIALRGRGVGWKDGLRDMSGMGRLSNEGPWTC
ncbi:hypothetical protein BDZ45DRAFT_670814 [Acephala macrosclerotiorum]|nr:hypothetical protein BDZ45DRAFT_670814 [Acephala macrosclerotiorum]